MSFCSTSSSPSFAVDGAPCVPSAAADPGPTVSSQNGFVTGLTPPAQSKDGTTPCLPTCRRVPIRPPPSQLRDTARRPGSRLPPVTSLVPRPVPTPCRPGTSHGQLLATRGRHHGHNPPTRDQGPACRRGPCVSA